jgi:hypothetical protein
MENHFFLPESRLVEFNSSIKEVKGLLLEVMGRARELTDWIPEMEAQKLLGLKETSLWALRKRKQLVYSKIGSKTFYSLKSIEKLLSKNQK